MWSFFSRDAVKDFGYEIGTDVEWETDLSIWKLRSGKKKSTGESVSVFTFEVTLSDSQSLLDVAKSCVKRLKTMRHPSILTYIDSLETEKIVYLVTEKVEPLYVHLNKIDYSENQKTLAISWGLHQIASGLGFLNKDCSLSHNNICLTSVFVTRGGDWRLFGLEHVVPCNERPPPKVIFALQRYNPPELESSSQVKGHNWSYDSWGLGCLIWEIFNGYLQKSSALKSLGKIPSNLGPCYNELVSTNPTSRPSTINFLKKASKTNGFFKNKFVETMLFLREIHIKENEEKLKFFNNLSSVLDSFPQDICLYKVLPELVNAFEYGNAGSSVLTPMFKLGKLLNEEEYQQKIVPCVIKMFSSKERSTRAKLLQQMEEFIDHFSPSVVNAQIFPSVAQGFMDTSPVIREYTIKCMFYLAPKLNYQNLNEEMLKHFARLQTKDEQGGIRTNTTVCLGKIASYLHPQVRKKILISAFFRGLKDSFPPARTAAIRALSATERYHSINDCAVRIVPALSHFTVDPEKSVRDEAFRAIAGFLQKLQKVSEDPSLAEEMEKEVQSMTPSAAAASWTSWAVTSLVDKLHMPSLSRSASSSTANIAPSGGDTESKDEKPAENKENEAIPEKENPPDVRVQEENVNADGWGADWNDLDDEPEVAESAPSETRLSLSSKAAEPEASGEWEVDDWESFEQIDTFQETSVQENKLKSFFPDDQSPDPFTEIVNKSKGLSSPSEKPKSGADGWGAGDDQWGGWDDVSTVSPSATPRSSERHQRNAEERQQREEKRKQRLKERQLAKPKKLGAQKIS